MKEVLELLAEPLNTDSGHVLAEQLAKRAAWQARISQMHREAEHLLSEVRGKVFNPSLSSEDKRKLDLEYNTREFQRKADELKDISDILKQHISLGQTLVKSFTQELSSGIR